jgi:hypothetical protein
MCEIKQIENIQENTKMNFLFKLISDGNFACVFIEPLLKAQ